MEVRNNQTHRECEEALRRRRRLLQNRDITEELSDAQQENHQLIQRTRDLYERYIETHHLLEDFAAPPYLCPVCVSKLVAVLAPSTALLPRYPLPLLGWPEGDPFAPHEPALLHTPSSVPWG